MIDSIIKTQQFSLAVRQELGYPLVRTTIDSLAFASGGPVDFFKGMEIARLTEEMRRDMVYTAWNDFADHQPANIIVALREMFCVEVIDPCFLWAADETAPLAIVSILRDVHMVIGERGLLERRVGRPAKTLGAGRKLAMKRVRAAAAAMDDELLANNMLVPRGAPWIDPAPTQDETIVRFH
jgi:hypothetical protein